jgi:hypothetical protein
VLELVTSDLVIIRHATREGMYKLHNVDSLSNISNLSVLYKPLKILDQ